MKNESVLNSLKKMLAKDSLTKDERLAITFSLNAIERVKELETIKETLESECLGLNNFKNQAQKIITKEEFQACEQHDNSFCCCPHPIVVIVNGENLDEVGQAGPKTTDLIVRCGTCSNEFARIHEKGRKIINLSRHQDFS